jgi:hypothetical protein
MSIAVTERLLVSIKDAAYMLSLTPWSVYQLCEAGEIESRYNRQASAGRDGQHAAVRRPLARHPRGLT